MNILRKLFKQSEDYKPIEEDMPKKDVKEEKRNSNSVKEASKKRALELKKASK